MTVESRNQDELVGELKFTTSLSKIGQCAMLKSYEDELYMKLKLKFPKQHLPRVNTPTFNLQSSATRTNDISTTPSLCSLPSYSSFASTNSTITRKTYQSISSWDLNAPENEQIRKFQVSRQIEEAMEILDDINKIKSDGKESKNQIKEDEVDILSNASNDYRYDSDRRDSFIDIDSIDLHKYGSNDAEKAIKKYEKWQHNWSRMLNDMF